MSDDDDKEKELEELSEIVNEEEPDNEEEIVEEIETEEAEETNEIIEEPVEETKEKRKTAIIVVEIIVILALIGLILYFFVFKKKDDTVNEVTEPTTKEIARPSSDIEYVPVKQSTFELVCNTTKDGQKIKTLKKGMIIECVLKFEASQRVSELYFDLSASKNLKFSSYKNESGYKIDSDGKTYKFTTYEPLQKMTDGVNFYYEVTDENEKTGYIELKDVIFKDDNDKYYKALNSLTTFPVEYDDKIYIYKGTYENDVYYFARKSIKTEDEDECEDCDVDENIELIDTFQCEDETCEVLTDISNYFLIYDKQLIVYDPLKKTTRKVKLDDEIKIDDYDYELTLGSNNNIMGILFEKGYIDNYDCSSGSGCFDNGLSGYKVGYYSFNSNTFTIALDYGWIGNSEFNEYDRVLLLQKDNKIGAFSYEDDDMILTESEEYLSADYDDDLNAIALEVKDSNGNYYYKYFDLDTKSFKLNTKRLQKFEDGNLFYTLRTNRLGLTLAMLFNTKGESVKKLPFVVNSIIQSVDNRITTYVDGYYKVYELDGTFVYSSSFQASNIIDKINIPDASNSIIILDIDGKYAIETDIGKYTAICDNTETNEYIKSVADVENDKLEVYIKDSSVTEEDKNGYKYVLTAGETEGQIVVTPETTLIK